MGAWGVGMQANDTALDAIGNVQKLPQALKVLEKELNTEDDEYGTNSAGLLGIVDLMLDNGWEIPTAAIPKIKKVIKLHLSKNCLADWKDQKERKEALERFRDRLAGKKVDHKDIAIDNLGLFDSLDTHGKSRKEIKKLIK